MEMYRVTTYLQSIEKFKVVSETEKQLKYIREDGRVETQAKKGKYHSWHKTFIEAFDAIELYISSEIKQAQSQIDYRIGQLKKFHEKYSKEEQNGLG